MSSGRNYNRPDLELHWEVQILQAALYPELGY